jgi:NAD-dependent deacetylase
MGRLLIFAGAGVSQESGLSTFRDTGGIWTQYNVDELCHIQKWIDATKENTPLREEIFEFYNQRKKEIQKALPNAAHFKVAEWQQRYGLDKVVIVTSNVDDLFEKAGCTNIIHVHGETTTMKCAACGEVWDIGQAEYDHTTHCPKCDSRYTKPNIIFFGEIAPKYNDMNYHFHPDRRSQDDVFVYAGSSMSVLHPVTLLGNPRKDPRANWGHKILVNKDTDVCTSLFDYAFFGKATEEFENVDELIQANMLRQ